MNLDQIKKLPKPVLTGVPLLLVVALYFAFGGSGGRSDEDKVTRIVKEYLYQRHNTPDFAEGSLNYTSFDVSIDSDSGIAVVRGHYTTGSVASGMGNNFEVRLKKWDDGWKMEGGGTKSLNPSIYDDPWRGR